MSKRVRPKSINQEVAHACVVAIRENDEDHKWKKKMETITKRMKLVECGLCGDFIDTKGDPDHYTRCKSCNSVFCDEKCTSNVLCNSKEHDNDINWDPVCINCEKGVSLSGFKICSDCGDIMKK